MRTRDKIRVAQNGDRWVVETDAGGMGWRVVVTCATEPDAAHALAYWAARLNADPV